MITQKPPPIGPKKEENPSRSLPGIVKDPNHPTQPTRREVERPNPAPQPPVQQPGTSPPAPEFERRRPHETDQPGMDAEPTGLILRPRRSFGAQTDVVAELGTSFAVVAPGAGCVHTARESSTRHERAPRSTPDVGRGPVSE